MSRPELISKFTYFIESKMQLESPTFFLNQIHASHNSATPSLYTTEHLHIFY